VAGPIDKALKYESGLSLFKHKILCGFSLLRCSYVLVFSENLSLIPLLGLVLFVHDGGTKCLELDLFYNLVID
jgi:hypothetical protein